MKNSFALLITILTSFFSFAQNPEINWMTFEEALESQKKEPKKIMMDVYTTWCGPCKMLDKFTFHNADVVDYINKHFYAVKFDAEGNQKINYKGMIYDNPEYQYNRSPNSQHQLASYFTVTSYPTVLFIDENANPILPLPGFRQPNDFELFLKIIATNKYSEFKTQEEFVAYKENFKPEFRQ